VAQELTYALITPYSLLKSRTGGIIGRLMVMGDLDLVGAHMYAPSDEFVDRYIESVKNQGDMPGRLKTAMVAYIDENFRPENAMGLSNRTVLLLFRGHNAMETLRKHAVGALTTEPKGDTVRGTYGDFLRYPDGALKYFEPAVLTAGNPASNIEQLSLFARYARSDGGNVERALKLPADPARETTLVILKPENFSKKSVRPGNIVDIFSHTGLFIVGAKVLRMSVAQAMEFYAPLMDIFPERLKGRLAAVLREGLEKSLNFKIEPELYDKMADLLKLHNARYEFNRIVEYMTGMDPDAVAKASERCKPGKLKCLALLYHGAGAINKIRERLGPTDPSKAPEGTVRSDFGQSLMSNAAHASDSRENAERERRIIGFAGTPDEPCEVEQVILEYLDSAGHKRD